MPAAREPVQPRVRVGVHAGELQPGGGGSCRGKAACVNTPGSIRCVCSLRNYKSGYKLDRAGGACKATCQAGVTCRATGAALVAKLKAAKSGDKLALICTAAACCVISGVQLKVPKTVEVKLEYATMKDYTVRSPLLPHAPRAPLLPCG